MTAPAFPPQHPFAAVRPKGNYDHVNQILAAIRSPDGYLRSEPSQMTAKRTPTPSFELNGVYLSRKSLLSPGETAASLQRPRSEYSRKWCRYNC